MPMVREGTIEEPAPSQRMSHEWVPFSFEFLHPYWSNAFSRIEKILIPDHSSKSSSPTWGFVIDITNSGTKTPGQDGAQEVNACSVNQTATLFTAKPDWPFREMP
jgi:hypothetical protein